MVKKHPQERLKTKVRVKKIDKRPFYNEILSNGVVKATRKASIPFKVASTILNVYVANGDRVSKGALLAQLESRELNVQYRKAKLAYDKSLIDLKDKLLTYGVSSIEDTTKIRSEQLIMAKIESGYTRACIELESAKEDLRNVEVRAPFHGVISDLKAESFNPTTSYKKCCNIINDRKVWIDFTILEEEVLKVTKGARVKIILDADRTHTITGEVVSIDPSVDANGMVHVRGILSNAQHRLMDGMKADVIVSSLAGERLVVPKSAVLYRQSKKVVFVHHHGTAEWVYVKVGEENSQEVTIIEGDIKEGDEVVVSNNFNLAHKTPIQVIR
ncbi:efflux RND transporter periplasmic adaptor subunit [Halosquirtibacter laminarini]|uniref:Efflux RND transporter periplasmic adaptor subunit n=1 Tax=Halosquirtibacter laminarini TaxID=3374600 RepID=A0AC61NHS8_9BACT|nr:efflux RND transporter periplasmic adaptor subunit [Prolixibacteraceae bacterium]